MAARRIPSTMKAAAVDDFGPPAALTLHDVPLPQPDSGEVLIAVHTAGIGEWDAAIRDGSWRTGPVKFPLIPGTDGSGTVVARGGRVRRFEIGDRVYGFEAGNAKGGWYAEYAVASAKHVAHVPEALDMVHAGAAAATGLTALQGVDDALHVRKGQTVLIFGASGAVGTLAVQFAKRTSARVIGTASGKEAQSLVRRLGADAVLDARSDDFLDRLRLQAPDGLDAVLALAGGPALEQAIDLVKRGGRVAYPNGIEPEPKRRRKLRFITYDAVAGPRELTRLERAVNQARLQVPIAGRYQLEEAAQAHQRLEEGHIAGRLVLRIG